MSSPSRTISRIPGEGASVIPLAGYDLGLLTGLPTGLQSVVPMGFRSSWTGTLDELLAQIDADPSELVDDAAALDTALRAALATGHPIALPYDVYINTPIDITCGLPTNGERIELIFTGNGSIVGGPDIDGPLIALRNSSTQGATASGSVDLLIWRPKMTTEKTPRVALSSHDCLYLTGFRDKTVMFPNLRAGDHYIDAGGDSGIFSTGGRSTTVAFGTFQGFPDLGFYGSGNSTGTVFLENVHLIGNTYINCNNAWSVKRNMSMLCSTNEIFVGCYNGCTGFEATGTGDGLLSGHTVTVSGPIFKNMVNRCIDPRKSKNWNVTGLVARGTIGIDRDDTIVAGAAVVCVSGSVNCHVEGLAEVTGSDAGNSLVRIQSSDGVQSTGNKVEMLAMNSTIANGLLETNSSDKNEVLLKVGSGVTTVFSIVGAATSVRWDKDGVKGYQIGVYDRQEGRTPIRGPILESSNIIGPAAGNSNITVFQPTTANLNATLPAGALSGDRFGVMKHESSGVGLVLVRDPTNTTSLVRLKEPGDIVWMVARGDDTFYADGGVQATYDRTPIDGAAAYTVNTTLSTNLLGKIALFAPAASNIKAIMPAAGANGALIGIRRSGLSAGVLLIRDSGDTTTLARIYGDGDTVWMVRDGAGVWGVATRTLSQNWTTLRSIAAASVPTPDGGDFQLFIDSADSLLKTKNSSGTVTAV